MGLKKGGEKEHVNTRVTSLCSGKGLREGCPAADREKGDQEGVWGRGGRRSDSQASRRFEPRHWSGNTFLTKRGIYNEEIVGERGRTKMNH